MHTSFIEVMGREVYCSGQVDEHEGCEAEFMTNDNSWNYGARFDTCRVIVNVRVRSISFLELIDTKVRLSSLSGTYL